MRGGGLACFWWGVNWGALLMMSEWDVDVAGWR